MIELWIPVGKYEVDIIPIVGAILYFLWMWGTIKEMEEVEKVLKKLRRRNKKGGDNAVSDSI